jgi:hypothetical protein
MKFEESVYTNNHYIDYWNAMFQKFTQYIFIACVHNWFPRHDTRGGVGLEPLTIIKIMVSNKPLYILYYILILRSVEKHLCTYFTVFVAQCMANTHATAGLYTIELDIFKLLSLYYSHLYNTKIRSE